MAPTTKTTGPRLVKVRIPDEYGTFYSSRGEGKPDIQYKGGQVAEVTEREAEAYALEILQDPTPAAPTTTSTPAGGTTPPPR